MSKKILIANRGEIARRILCAAKELGFATVAIYADPDQNSFVVREADEAYPLEGIEAKDTYLNIEKILKIAKQANVKWIHPGYGFLSENSAFVEACVNHEIGFVGPSAKTMQALGSKVAAKALAQRAGVPVVPGYQGELPRGKALLDIAEEIGYPLLIKAAAGGGGRGMRVVHQPDQLETEAKSAEREAEAFFKDKTIFIEKYIETPRHIEVQVLGDTHGNLVHLYERECSLQRRHQKLIEEAPSPSISPAMREKICGAALRIATEAGYYSAGTVEFIVDPKDQFYFLEVNTRLQVEHPVTEAVTGIDLVKAQLLVAEGHRLPFNQEDILLRGHAIEARLCAEDPQNGFLPAEGEIGVLREPSRPGVRIDSSLQEGMRITTFYDSMLAKLIVSGLYRKEALAKLDALLRDYVLLGIRHNLDFLRYALRSKPFWSGAYHTHTVTEILPAFLEERTRLEKLPVSALLAAALAAGSSSNASGIVANQSSEASATPTGLKGFRNA